jgi:hypothetical protein
MTDIRNCSGALRYQNEPIGTAFLVHESGLLATCRHVLYARTEHPDDVMFTFAPFGSMDSLRTFVYGVNMEHDVALLKLTDLPPAHMVPARLIRSQHVRPGTTFALVGYGELTDNMHRYDYISATGEITGTTRRNDVDVFRLESQGLLPGMSGSAVWVEQLAGVVGIQFGRFTVRPGGPSWMEGTGWAAKIDILAELDSRIQLCDPPETAAEASVTNITSTVNIADRGGRNISLSGNSVYCEQSGTPPRDEQQ